jgi:hypothetical protein
MVSNLVNLCHPLLLCDTIMLYGDAIGLCYRLVLRACATRLHMDIVMVLGSRRIPKEAWRRGGVEAWLCTRLISQGQAPQVGC